MKKLICLLFLTAALFLSTACSNQEVLENDTDTDVVENNSDNNEESSSEGDNLAGLTLINEDEEPYFAFELANPSGDYIDVAYRESGVSFTFFGENEYQNGYAFIAESETMYGEAIFFEEGTIEGDYKTIYIIKDKLDGVYVSNSMENYWEEGEYYYFSGDALERKKADFYGDEGETQYWVATDTVIYSLDAGVEIVPENTYATMTTTNQGGTINLNMQGNGEWFLNNYDSTLGFFGEWGGIYAGGEIHLTPDLNTLYVNIRYIDAVYFDTRSVALTFERREEGYDIYEHVEFDEDSAPLTFVDKELERLLAEYLNLSVGEIKKEHMELIKVIAIGGNALHPYETDEMYFNYTSMGYVEEGTITTLEDLKYCTNLKEIYIGKNQISDISALSELNELKVINFTMNQISDVSALNSLTNLEKLTLDHNNISSVEGLVGLENLKLLDLGSNNGNSFNDVESISKLTSLESLTLYNNACSDISALASLTNLEFLSLSTNGISDVSALEGLENLNRLYLGQNYELTDVSPLNNLLELSYLSLKKTGVSDSSQLPNLVENYTSIEFE